MTALDTDRPRDIVHVVNAILSNRRRVLVPAVLAAALTGVVTLLTPRDWTSVGTFVPAGQRLPSSLSGLAAQLGVALPTGDANTNPQFYSQLLGSREILEAVLLTRFPRRGTVGDSAELISLLGVRSSDPIRRMDKGLEKLRRRFWTSADLKTGVVSLGVSMRDPQLAQDVANRFLGLLNEYNLRRRQSQASSERAFTERRLAEVKADLRNAEDALEGFLRRNRDIRNSPELSFQQDRLGREVSLQQALYGSLAQAYEQARLEEVRDTPVISVLDHPGLPLRADTRLVLLKMLIMFLLGAGAGALWGFGVAEWNAIGLHDSLRAGDSRALFREALADLQRPWRLFRRTGGTPGQGP